MSKKIKGYKGFQKGLVCRDKKYQVGKEYKHKGDIKLCESGFHFCENPLDVLEYYDLVGSEFAEVEAIGKVENDEKKSVTDKIKIKAKLDLSGFIKASVDFLFEKCKVGETGGDSIQANKEDSAQLASSGYYAKLASSGDYAKLELNGKDTVGAAIGIESKIKGKKGNWITLAEYQWDGKGYKPICVRSAQIDGKIIKADTFYQLINGEFKQV